MTLTTWLAMHALDVGQKSCSAELYILPENGYKDEKEWNETYVALHHSLTTGPMVQLIDRFARNIPPHLFSPEHLAFVERVCIDGLERNPPHLVPHYTKREAARTYELLSKIRGDHKLSAYAAMYVQRVDRYVPDDTEMYANLVLQRTFMTIEGRCIPNALVRTTTTIGSTRYRDWVHAYEALRQFAMRVKNEWTPEERKAAFERLVYAASISDHPKKWLEVAAGLYVGLSDARPPYTPMLHDALLRCKTGYPLCDPWYVRYLDSVHAGVYQRG